MLFILLFNPAVGLSDSHFVRALGMADYKLCTCSLGQFLPLPFNQTMFLYLVAGDSIFVSTFCRLMHINVESVSSVIPFPNATSVL